MGPFVIYLALVLLALIVFAVSAMLTPPARRRCPSCDEALATTARLCRRCGYAFA
jgi:predicted amidophosphoribosyltransferase